MLLVLVARMVSSGSCVASEPKILSLMGSDSVAACAGTLRSQLRCRSTAAKDTHRETTHLNDHVDAARALLLARRQLLDAAHGREARAGGVGLLLRDLALLDVLCEEALKEAHALGHLCRRRIAHDDTRDLRLERRDVADAHAHLAHLWRRSVSAGAGAESARLHARRRRRRS
jgi:hypothetical protein